MTVVKATTGTTIAHNTYDVAGSKFHVRTTQARVAAKTIEYDQGGQAQDRKLGQMVMQAPERPIHLPQAASDDVPGRSFQGTGPSQRSSIRTEPAAFEKTIANSGVGPAFGRRYFAGGSVWLGSGPFFESSDLASRRASAENMDLAPWRSTVASQPSKLNHCRSSRLAPHPADRRQGSAEDW